MQIFHCLAVVKCIRARGLCIDLQSWFSRSKTRGCGCSIYLFETQDGTAHAFAANASMLFKLFVAFCSLIYFFLSSACRMHLY